MKNPTVSFPDSLSIVHALQFEERNGSLGASILRRFTVTFDYINSKITLKKGSSFRVPFRYNMSGIELMYNGKLLVKEEDDTSLTFSNNNSQETIQQNRITFDYNNKYSFKSSYRIYSISVGSPAYKAGLLRNDIIIKINGKYTYN